MSLRFAILAALLDGEASGYDLAKRFDVSVANFWSTTPQQLYRELERMHVDELIAAEIVEQSKRPNKRVFALTRVGRDALQEFSAQPTRPVVIRDELLVKVQALNASAPQSVHKSLVERAALAQQKLDRYQRLRSRLLDGRTEEEHLRTTENLGPYLTLMGGIALERESLAWAEDAQRILAARYDL